LSGKTPRRRETAPDGQQHQNQNRNRDIAKVENRSRVVDGIIARREHFANVTRRCAEKKNGAADAGREPEIIPKKDAEHSQNAESQIGHGYLELKRTSRRPADGGGRSVGKKGVAPEGEQSGTAHVEDEKIKENRLDDPQRREFFSPADQAGGRKHNREPQKENDVHLPSPLLNFYKKRLRQKDKPEVAAFLFQLAQQFHDFRVIPAQGFF